MILMDEELREEQYRDGSREARIALKDALSERSVFKAILFGLSKMVSDECKPRHDSSRLKMIDSSVIDLLHLRVVNSCRNWRFSMTVNSNSPVGGNHCNSELLLLFTTKLISHYFNFWISFRSQTRLSYLPIQSLKISQRTLSPTHQFFHPFTISCGSVKYQSCGPFFVLHCNRSIALPYRHHPLSLRADVLLKDYVVKVRGLDSDHWPMERSHKSRKLSVDASIVMGDKSHF